VGGGPFPQLLSGGLLPFGVYATIWGKIEARRNGEAGPDLLGSASAAMAST